MASFGHPIALAVALIALTGTATAQSSGNSADKSATGIWEDNANAVSQSIDRDVAKRCGASDSTCQGASARPGDSRGSGASGMPGDAPSRASGGASAAPAAAPDGSAYRQW